VTSANGHSFGHGCCGVSCGFDRQERRTFGKRAPVRALLTRLSLRFRLERVACLRPSGIRPSAAVVDLFSVSAAGGEAASAMLLSSISSRFRPRGVKRLRYSGDRLGAAVADPASVSAESGDAPSARGHPVWAQLLLTSIGFGRWGDAPSATGHRLGAAAVDLSLVSALDCDAASATRHPSERSYRRARSGFGWNG